MIRKSAIVISIVLLVIVGGYFYLRFGVLNAKDFKPDKSKERNEIDLRPTIIAKLQQLVKDGSNGLYILSINDIEPDVLASRVDIKKASIHIDTTAMLRLDSLKLLPDDIFTFRFNSLYIDGIGMNDLLHKDRIDVGNINIVNPVINVYHKSRSYNQDERERKDKMSLYEKLKGQMKSIAIGNIHIKNGTFLNHDLSKMKVTKFNDVSVLINNLLIDSTTQYDTRRFLFAKNVTLNTKNYSVPTPDSLYIFKAGNISILGNQKKIILQKLELKPRLSRQQFQNKLQFRKEMYNISMNDITLFDVDWQAMINNEKLKSSRAEINGGTIKVFLDRSLPAAPVVINNYPHQLLMKVPFPVSVEKLNEINLNLLYEEYNPASGMNGTVFFDKINGELNYVSNITSDIKKHPVAIFSGSSLFMHHVPMKGKFQFNLSKFKTGEYKIDVQMNALDSATVNAIAEPLSLFTLKKGQMQHAVAHVEGNNFYAKGNIAMEYTNLHITPLKKDEGKGQLKSKSVSSFFANKLLIKDKNTGKENELRQPEFYVERGDRPNFFNLTWVSILTGILKTIGIPVKLVIK